MAVVKTRALILKTREYKEKDLLVYAFSQDLGKISILARGVRSKKGRYGAALMAMNLCDFVLYAGKGLYGLNEVFVIETFPEVKTDFDRITYGSYFLELADITMADGEVNERYFFDLLKAFYLLEQPAIPLELLARALEYKTLIRTGNYPDPALGQTMADTPRKIIWFLMNKPLEEGARLEVTGEDLKPVEKLAEELLKECFQRRPKSLDILKSIQSLGNSLT